MTRWNNKTTNGLRIAGWMGLAFSLIAGASGTIARAEATATAPQVVDASTMNGKVMCGYQGWFNTPTDGSGRNWVHWGGKQLADGQWSVDMLPDVSELDPDELCNTGIKYADGSPVQVYSAFNPKTVARHFKWMQDYGIDGVFLQRFAGGVGEPKTMIHYDRIVANVRAGAKQYGRAWGMMYDLSGVKPGGSAKIIEDWKKLAGTDHITQDKQYIHQNGKPIVVLWGLGFGNGTPTQRPDLFEDGLKLIDFLKNDPTYGGNTVMIGVPHTWHERIERHGPDYQNFEKVLLAADIIQPWAVGSCGTPEGAVQNAQKKWVPDFEWCKAHGRQYMPVVFPGFTWHNLRKGTTPSDQTPRLGGRFLWTQYVEAKKLGVPFVYEAMFDEVDEGTAIFKISDKLPPPGKSVFVGTHGLPSDFYLRLVGEATQLIRGQITPEQEKLIGKY